MVTSSSAAAGPRCRPTADNRAEPIAAGLEVARSSSAATASKPDSPSSFPDGSAASVRASV